LSPLLDELLDLCADLRPIRLAELRSSDLALADELESMLRMADEADVSNFLGGDVQFDAALFNRVSDRL
jgi:hypothetical protein